jgi:Zn-dependent M28 family amino/carboxypeptidase
MRLAAGLPLVLLFALASGGCPSEGGPAPAFDGARAWRDLRTQVEFGPRPAGSEANERCRTWIEAELRAAGLSPRRESFRARTPLDKEELALANVVAEIAPREANAGWIAIGTHFDTKRLPFQFVGANDGASSTAVVLELARQRQKRGPGRLGLRFLFFDGEEAVRPEWEGEDNTYGSRHHVAELVRAGRVGELKAFVLLDMVGDKDLRFSRDTLSDRRLLEIFNAAAQRAGLGRHMGGRSLEVRDDHVPFLQAGVRCVNLIDFEFGPDNSWWHTRDDTLEHCAQASLEAAGRIALDGLADLEAELTRGR